MAPKEVFGMELLSVNANLPEFVNVRSDQVESKIIKMIPQIAHSNWVTIPLGIVMVFGFVSVVYTILTVIQFAVT